MREKAALFLCNRTPNMIQPWVFDGKIRCVSVDVQGRPEWWQTNEDTWEHHECDVREFMPPLYDYVFCAAFPPCTNTAVSGARWFKDKGIEGLEWSVTIFAAVKRLCEWTGAPYMIEHPVSTLSSYIGKPDHTFHPADYAGYCEDDNYTKKTCLWTGGGFRMPPFNRIPGVEPDKTRIHHAPPSKDRGDIRSVTPMGFAQAVFEANRGQI